jgi:hypothetical protein
MGSIRSKVPSEDLIIGSRKGRDAIGEDRRRIDLVCLEVGIDKIKSVG